jgi:hypothetical protein
MSAKTAAKNPKQDNDIVDSATTADDTAPATPDAAPATPARAKKKPVEVANDVFVDTYLCCTSEKEVATKLNISVPTVHARAKKLRELKVELPTYTRAARGTVDVAALNARIRAFPNKAASSLV